MLTIVGRPETHSKADAEAIFNSRPWEKILGSIDQLIRSKLDRLATLDEPRDIYRLQGCIEGLKLLRKVQEDVLASYPKGTS